MNVRVSVRFAAVPISRVGMLVVLGWGVWKFVLHGRLFL